MKKIICKWCKMKVKPVEWSNKGYPERHEEMCIERIILEEIEAILGGNYICDSDTMKKVLENVGRI